MSLKKRVLRLSFYPWLACALGALFYCYEYYLRIMPGALHAELRPAFGLNASDWGHLVAFYYYAYAPMQLPVGMMMDRYGPRRLLMMACLCCVVGTYLFNPALGLPVAQWGRFLTGFGSAFAFVGGMKLAAIWLPRERFAFFSGLTTALGALGGIAGDVSLEYVVSALGTHGTMMASYALGLVVFLLLALLLFDRPDPSSDRPQTSTGQSLPLREEFLALWFILKKNQIWYVGAVGCLLYLSTSAFAELWGVPFLEKAYGMAEASARDVCSLIFLGWVLGGPFSGWLSDVAHNRKRPLYWGAVGALLTSAVLVFCPNLPYPLLYTLLLLFGVFCSVQVLVFAMARELCDDRLAATAMAVVNMMVMLGGVIFQPLLGKILDLYDVVTTGTVDHVYSLRAYQCALATLPMGAFIVLLLLPCLKETYGGRSE